MFIPLLSLVLFILVQSYPNGAPCSQVDNMMPNHGVGSAPGRAPFRIQIRAKCFKPGKSIPVTIRGKRKNKIKGFVLQARGNCPNTKETRIGDFVGNPANWKFQCPDDKGSITHTASVPKNKIKTKWMAKDGEEKMGKIRFVATIVKDYGKFWVMKVKSKVLKPCGKISTECNGPRRRM